MNSIMPIQQRHSSKQGFPLRLFAAAFVISLLTTIFSGWQSWQMHNRFDEMSAKHMDLERDIGRIMLLDEVLTMSARMAAATGDFNYEKRYDKFDPQLTVYINDVRADLPQPEIALFVGETDEANLALVKMERQAFALAHQGRRQEATALLTSDEYMRLKKVYAGGMEKTVNAAKGLIERETRQLRSQSLGLAVASAVGVLVLLAAWFFAIRSARGWDAEHREAQDALRKAHDELEVQVKQRTADLLSTNEELKCEISKHTVAKEKNQRLTQIYAALSQCNEAIVRCTSEAELFPKICRDAVQIGGMKMVWIGLVDETSQRVNPVAAFGYGVEYLEGIQISVAADDPAGRGPTGTSIRENQPFWCQDFQNDPVTAPWHERGARAGWGAAASLPLHRNGVAIGAFTLYASEANAFDEAARNLLVEMAMDISFALDNFAHESQRKRAQEEIEFKNTILQTQQETSLDAILVVDENEQIISYNQQFIDLWRLSRQIVSAGLDAPVLQAVVDQVENPEAFFARVQYLYEHRDEKSHEQVQLKDGRIIDRYSAPITGADGQYYGRIWYFRDITERKQAEADLRIAATAFESQEGMFVTDANSLILRVNRAFTNITGYPAEEVIGKNPHILNSGRQDANFYAAMWQGINNTDAWEGEIWNRRKNGEIYPEYLNITAVKDQNGTVTNYVATLSDITMSNEAADKIKHLAFYDPLTGLPNRRLLLDRLHQAFASSARSGREGALLFIDLDNFKDINDTLGHDLGDILLQQTAQRLGSCMRESDTVARLGGDEFVVMLEDLSEQSIEAATQTEAVGEKILATLNQPYQLATHTYHSTPSIGATLFNDHHQSEEELLKRADIAMYQAKKAGRNTLRFFNPKMQAIINVRTALESELRKALENQQFQLYYQIQVDSSHRPLGAEALIRWIHPERGLVSPDQFIPLAEKTGLILPIGQWVLETACTQLKAWQQDALTRGLILAVNVSAKQFRQADFVAQVQAVVQRHAINPMRLKLELTESMLLENIEDTIATMHALKEIGVRFSLDDFGTGYSSLQYLKRLPLDQLKIDQSFVRDLATDSSDKAIVRTIIAIAKSLEMGVIAEGVETEEQRQLLLDSGCTHYQGYLFGKPVPIGQFEALLGHG